MARLRRMYENIGDLTAPHVSAFVRNMTFGRLDSGLVNLETINKVIDDHDKRKK